MNTHERFRFRSREDLAAAIESRGLSIPCSEEIDILKEPLTIGGKVVPNRISAHPMEGCDGTADGKPGELTYRRYKRIAGGGTGLIWFEATAVVHEGRANPRQLLLSRDNIKDFRLLLDQSIGEAVRKFGADRKPYTVLQLTHSGRYSRPESGPQPVVAVKNPYLDEKFSGINFRVISDDEIEELEERFADAAIMAGDVGFDAVDIKSCHGYLNFELLSARTRDGRYGGSFENRTRFLLNIVDRIRSQSGNKPAVTLRLGAYDAVPYPYGWGVDKNDHRTCDLSEPIRLVNLLHEKGIHLISISAGNPYYNPHIGRPYDTGPYVPPEHPLRGVERMVHISRDIRTSVPGIKVMATGFSWMREFGAQYAAGGIRSGWYDLAGFGRQFLAYPDFPDDIITRGEMERKRCCITCGKCSEIMRYDGMAGCVVRDSDVYLPIYKQVSKEKPSLTGAATAEHI